MGGVKSLYHNNIFLQLETGGRTSIAIHLLGKSVVVDSVVQWDRRSRVYSTSLGTIRYLTRYVARIGTVDYD